MCDSAINHFAYVVPLIRHTHSPGRVERRRTEEQRIDGKNTGTKFNLRLLIPSIEHNMTSRIRFGDVVSVPLDACHGTAKVILDQWIGD